MPKKPQPHRYADRLSFERILLLIATLTHHPGIGSSDLSEYTSSDSYHNALEFLQTQICQFAQSVGISFPDNYPALSTLRKDLQTLRDYGILDKRMYRWGYYLGTGAMTRDELKIAFNALASLAQYQGDPLVRQVHNTLEKRLRGLDLGENGNLFYPVRAYLNRPIIYSDPDEMRAKGQYRHTLFSCLDSIEAAIATGQLVEISRSHDPYHGRVGLIQVYPLQLFYHDIAWYLLYEEVSTAGLYQPDEIQHLEVERVDRLKDHCRVIDCQMRGQEAQFESLKLAQKLMEMGWGIYLGTREDQQRERLNKVTLEVVKVRFFPPSTHFILEGECRHKSQKIKPIKDKNGTCKYVEYQVKLPRRSFPEFCRWVYRHLRTAQFISPPELVEQHKHALQEAIDRYHQ